MSKKTTVEWLKEQIECFGNKHELQMSWATLDELFEQAKAMEKEQIQCAYKDGLSWHPNDFTGKQQYYNQTYGGQDE